MINQLKALMENMPASMTMFDTNMNIVAASKHWLDRYGFKMDDVLGKNIYKLLPNIPEEWKDIHRRCLAGATEKREHDILYLNDGHQEIVKWEISPFRNEAGDICGIIMFSEIITEEDKSKKVFLKLFRELKLLIEVCDVVFDDTDEFDLIENVCKKIIQYGGYQLTWFGYAPDPLSDKQLISPLHKFGTAIHYLDDFLIDLNNEMHKVGPTAIALATGKSIVVSDFEHNTTFQPWMKNAQNHGLASSISIPLKFKNNKTAVLCIYANEKGAFNQEEINILDRLGVSITFAINSLHKIYENKVAQIKQDKLIKDLNGRNRSLEEFTYLVSHNLRAKVADLIGVSTLFTDFGVSGTEAIELMHDVKNISSKLDEVMRDLNSTLLVKSHTILNYDVIDLQQTFKEVISKLEANHPNEHIKIVTDFSKYPVMKSDRYYLFEVFFQLLLSLVKHNTEQRFQEITVVSQLNNNHVTLSFIDDFDGITLKNESNNTFEIYAKLGLTKKSF